MFQQEADMTRVVDRWMRSSGLTTKSEFVTPWGICDLVGLKFKKASIRHRLNLKQTKALSSITRMALLLQIPDVETYRSTTLRRLAQQCAPSVPADIVAHEVEHLITDRYVMQSGRGRLQKVNGWMPLHDRLIAIELKMARVDEAMCQARDNLGFADESYVAFPSKVARRVFGNPSRWPEFFRSGIGLISVTRCQCRVLVAAGRAVWQDEAIQAYCVEKFWRTRTRDS